MTDPEGYKTPYIFLNKHCIEIIIHCTAKSPKVSASVNNLFPGISAVVLEVQMVNTALLSHLRSHTLPSHYTGRNINNRNHPHRQKIERQGKIKNISISFSYFIRLRVLIDFCPVSRGTENKKRTVNKKHICIFIIKYIK